MQLRYGLLAELVAAPGEGDALAAFLASARETAAREEGTVTWYAFKLSDTTRCLPTGRCSRAPRPALPDWGSQISRPWRDRNLLPCSGSHWHRFCRYV